ncbi:MAG: hypothetical protein DRR16_06720 [Candidatus Parabeggiatoa sp. nov. 3]|nr:MAG: hypothetical protein DRR00_20295 [Gammaproteobacteria bacterium]RKZ65166.1 MAG: hypothetical protein DRQ99_13495 [Gammaproteobacteria bacterium]RKZ87685.1 MAG: hypothetical protein DRR16_06720 [Gammaproteobacteria bacterium]
MFSLKKPLASLASLFHAKLLREKLFFQSIKYIPKSDVFVIIMTAPLLNGLDVLKRFLDVDN